MIRVVIVDDQTLLREALGYILDGDSQIEVIGFGGNGSEAVELCDALVPDIVLMDIEMPGMNGINASLKIKEKHKDIKIIMLTTFETPANIIEAFVAKVDGYIVKDINHEKLILAVKAAMSGLTVIHESVQKVLVDKFNKLNGYKVNYSEILTDKDVEIIKLIARGDSNKRIAEQLNYAEGTIKNNVSKILTKLNMSHRMQIAIFAMENGLR